MTDAQGNVAKTSQMTRDFIASYVDRDADDRQFAQRIRTRLYSAQYRREREQHPEWVDFGGEGG